MSFLKHTSLLLFPVGISALSAAFYLETLNTQVTTPMPEPTTVRGQSFFVLDYPETTQLVQLPREWPTAELISNTEGSLPAREHANGEPGIPSPQGNDELAFSLNDIDLSSLSPDLALKVENALSGQGKARLAQSLPLNDLEGNSQKWQGRLPALNLQTHMYASDAKRRWVKINNVEYHQGDVVDGQVMLKEIQPQAVIVEFQGEQIRIPALYEWQG